MQFNYGVAAKNHYLNLLLQNKKWRFKFYLMPSKILTKNRFKKKLNILPFAQLCLFFKIQFMQQYTQTFLPVALNNMWITNNERRQNQAHVILRNDDSLHIPLARTLFTSKHPLTTFPQLWADFPDESITFIRNKLELNKTLKKYFLNNLNANVNCGRLLCSESHLNGLLV